MNGFPSVVKFSVSCYTSSEVGECGVWFELYWVDEVSFANESEDDVSGGELSLGSPGYVSDACTCWLLC